MRCLPGHLLSIRMTGKTKVGAEVFQEVFVFTAVGVMAPDTVAFLEWFVGELAFIKIWMA